MFIIMTKPEILEVLHSLIDKKFKRKNRSELIERSRLQQQITLYAISAEFLSVEAFTVSALLQEMVAEKLVVTNLGNENVHPFDAYFLPVSELKLKNENEHTK